MITRWRIALALAFATLLGGLAWETLSHGEPTYAGKPLSFWLKGFDIGYNDPRKPSHDQSVEALREAGTNAIPTLLRMLRSRDSDLNHRLTRLLAKQRVIKVDYVSADRQRWAAREALSALGLAAKPAIPELVAIARQETVRSEWHTQYAKEILDDLKREWPREVNNDIAGAIEMAIPRGPTEAFSKETQNTGEPNPQRGANGRQPVSLETNSISAAAASRRSP
jgi:hypothetical protein